MSFTLINRISIDADKIEGWTVLLLLSFDLYRKLRLMYLIILMSHLNSIASFLDTLGGGEGILDG